METSMITFDVKITLNNYWLNQNNKQFKGNNFDDVTSPHWLKLSIKSRLF